MIPEELQKSNLAVELKAGKKRLEDVLRGLSDEQCERAGAARSGPVIDVLSEIVRTEILALADLFHRSPGSPVNHSANADRRTRVALEKVQIAARSIEALLSDFRLLRSVLIRHVEGRGSQGVKIDSKCGYLADSCVTEFNKRVKEIERWRSSEIVGFNPKRLRADSRESELNRAIVDLSWEDFLVGNFDLNSLFSLSFESFYSDDFVLWLGTEEAIGKTGAFERMAEVLEPFFTLFEMGMAFVETFRVTGNFEDAEGNFITDWETVLGGRYSTGVVVRWRTIRAWKNRMVIAERIEDLPSPNVRATP